LVDVFLSISIFSIYSSLFFFVRSSGLTFPIRVASSSHGVFAVLAAAYANYLDYGFASCGLPYSWVGSQVLLCCAAVSIILCIFRYPGPRFHHVLHVAPVALVLTSFPIIVLMAASKLRDGVCFGVQDAALPGLHFVT
jgi:hypothetical protein